MLMLHHCHHGLPLSYFLHENDVAERRARYSMSARASEVFVRTGVCATSPYN
jgi:hypothetical protein